MTKTVCWIHGAYSSDRAFNYLRTKLPSHRRLVFEYDVRTPLELNLESLSQLLDSITVDGIVGHSLGGVMAALMVKREYAPRGVAIASPLGGFPVANFFPLTQLLVDVASTRRTFTELKAHNFEDKLLNIVASYDGRWTDGVVPVNSQLSVKTDLVEKVHMNHFEVLLDEKIGEMINDHIFKK